jgi:hypothetical protein
METSKPVEVKVEDQKVKKPRKPRTKKPKDNRPMVTFVEQEITISFD